MGGVAERATPNPGVAAAEVSLLTKVAGRSQEGYLGYLGYFCFFFSSQMGRGGEAPPQPGPRLSQALASARPRPPAPARPPPLQPLGLSFTH